MEKKFEKQIASKNHTNKQICKLVYVTKKHDDLDNIESISQQNVVREAAIAGSVLLNVVSVGKIFVMPVVNEEDGLAYSVYRPSLEVLGLILV